MARLFNASLVGKKAHVSVPAGNGKVVQFPVVNGVVNVPGDLIDSAHFNSSWVPFNGQVSDVSDETLRQFKSASGVAKFHGDTTAKEEAE